MDGEMALVATDESKPTVYDQYKVGGGSKKFSELPYQGLPCLQELGDSTTSPMSQKAVTDATSTVTKELKDDMNTNTIRYSMNRAEIDRLNSFIKENLSDGFYITDNNGNIVFQVTKDGINYIGKDEELQAVKDEINKINEKVDKNSINSMISAKSADNYLISDSIGNIIAGINKSGLRTTNINITESDNFYITDNNGNIAFEVSNNGVNYIGKESDRENINIKEGYYPSDIVLNILYGQSLTQQGIYSGKEDLSSILSFKNGNSVRTLSNPDDSTACDEYFGTDFIPAKNTGLATAIGFCNKVWMEVLKKENNVDIRMKEGTTPYFDFQLLGSVPGDPGSSWGSLADNNNPQYKKLLKSVEYGKKIAMSHGCTFKVGVLCWMQGENSADKTNSLKLYYDKLWVAFSNLNNDIKAITGQEDDIKFITYQMASHKSDNQVASGATDGTPLALLQIGLDKGLPEEGYELEAEPKSKLRTTLINRDLIFSGPTLYPYQHSDGVHLINNSYHKVGSLFGIISKRIITDKEKWYPIYPISHSINVRSDGKYLLSVKFHVPVPPLVFDFTNIGGEQPNYGFSIKNTSGQEIIESLVIKRGDTLNIVCSSNPTGQLLYYAESAIKGGGNLRDSQGDKLVTDIEGVPYHCHNWAPIFKYQL